MARYKIIDTNPRLLPVVLTQQLIPGTFEHALNHLLDNEIDLSGFDGRYCNDLTGAPAYPPAMLLKVVLFAHSRGIVSSRGIEAACQQHVTFIALCGDHAPHFTTIARFVSNLGDQAAHIFGAVLAICAREKLIGREMFAIDGVKLPSNASKHRSGTRADFERQAQKMEEQAKAMIARHRAENERRPRAGKPDREEQRIERLERETAQLRQWLADNHNDRKGSSSSGRKPGVRQSNRTDNESAKLATDKGVIQGYTAVAAVDAQAQIVVSAQAHGTGNEHELLMPVIDELAPAMRKHTTITADAGYHCEANLVALHRRGVRALIADKEMRRRDPRFSDREHHLTRPDPLHNKRAKAPERTLFGPEDFRIDPDNRTCLCPAGKHLYRKGANCKINGFRAMHFQGAKRDCLPCTLRDQCLRTPDITATRQVAVFLGKVAASPAAKAVTQSDLMRARIDAPEGRALYDRRFATVEPVFANLRHNKGLNRFTLRGRKKVDAQWKMFCLVQNIEKLARHGYAQ